MILRILLALVSLAVIVAVLGAAGWLWKSAGTPEMSVPDEVGLPAAVAQANLVKMGLGVELIEEPGPDTMTGRVIRMSPAPGLLVKPGRVIILYVASGSGAIVVPDLVGTYLIEAENRLGRAGMESGVLGGLVLGERSSVTHDSPAGTILSQSPMPGTIVKPGTPVSVVVAVPAEGMRMPNLVGRLLNQAMDTLAAAGYTAITAEPYYTTSRATNTILSQEPAPGTPLQPGMAIKLVVATPPASRIDDPSPFETPPPGDLPFTPEPDAPDVNTPGATFPDAEAPPTTVKPPPTRAPAPAATPATP